MDSDDDMPPPLEDMSEKIEAVREAKKKLGQGVEREEEHVEEVRLGGGLSKASSQIPMSSGIPPKEEP